MRAHDPLVSSPKLQISPKLGQPASTPLATHPSHPPPNTGAPPRRRPLSIYTIHHRAHVEVVASGLPRKARPPGTAVRADPPPRPVSLWPGVPFHLWLWPVTSGLARCISRHLGHDLVVKRDAAGQKHLLQALAGCNHGQADVGDGAEIGQDRALGVDETFDGGGQVADVVAGEGFEAVGLGEHHKVWVDVVGGDEAAVKEELLPDLDHLLRAVVHDGHLDR
mmetsp:Transcript_37710/g.121208  ORF Transcript_37710/g.121208 Transcript_37710/m.121208 type:complete len:222 (-) Transcript_37710:1568-2233(-)